ncbi:MAG: DUF1772 domain-containing protein [Beijerinckiaceae bacterium]
MHLRTFFILVSTIALGFIAGFFYTYEVSVMRGFATVRNWAFAPSFFGAVLLTVVTAILHLPKWREPKTMLIMAATLAYGLGAFLLTVRINVPMNEWLALQDPADLIANPNVIRAQYEQDWVFWNLVRTINSGLAFALMACALWLNGRQSSASR